MTTTDQTDANAVPDDPSEEIDAGTITGVGAPQTTAPNQPLAVEVKSDGAGAGSTLNAGTVSGVGDLQVPVINRIQINHSWTAIILAVLLVIILVGTTSLHYYTVLQLAQDGKTEVATQVSTIFDKWFPVITGFTGSAITYFLTKDRQ